MEIDWQNQAVVEASDIEVHRPSPTRSTMHGDPTLLTGYQMRLFFRLIAIAQHHHRAPHLPKTQAGADEALITGMKQILIGHQVIGILINFKGDGLNDRDAGFHLSAAH